MIKHGATPLINALSTLLLVLTFTTVLVSQRFSKRSPGGRTIEKACPVDVCAWSGWRSPPGF